MLRYHPAISWQFIQGCTLPSPMCSWKRLQHPWGEKQSNINLKTKIPKSWHHSWNSLGFFFLIADNPFIFGVQAPYRCSCMVCYPPGYDIPFHPCLSGKLSLVVGDGRPVGLLGSWQQRPRTAGTRQTGRESTLGSLASQRTIYAGLTGSRSADRKLWRTRRIFW